MYTNLFPLIDSYTLERGNLIYIFSKACSDLYTSISSPDIQLEDSNIAFVLKYLAPERQMDSNIAPTDNIKGKCWPQKRERCSLKQPQFIGDGTIIKQCKTCNHLVGVRTLICDKCEEAFHISCLEEKVEQEDIDNWYCSPCQAYISQNEPPEYECKVCIGSRYQAEVPQE